MSILAVFDTNVIVSSLLSHNSDSPTVKVVDAIAEGTLVPLYSDDILLEYEDVLTRPKFSFSEETVSSILKLIKQFGIYVRPSPTGELLPDMDDLVFYEVVMEKRDDDAYLITGNIKHFPKREYIVTPAEMMKILEENK